MLRDATVFDDDHLPREIVGRNAQMNEVTDALAPIEDGFRAENCFLFGPSGAGKTTVARAAVRDLRREVLDVPTTYINCWKESTRSGVLERAAKGLANAAVPKNAPARNLIDKLEAALNSPSVIILDEVDQLRDRTSCTICTRFGGSPGSVSPTARLTSSRDSMNGSSPGCRLGTTSSSIATMSIP